MRILIVALLVVSCDDGPVTPPPDPYFSSAVVTENPHNTISAVTVVVATGYDSAFVRFWREGSPAAQSPRYAFNGDSIVRVPVLGLDTATTYSVETSLVLGGTGQVVDTADFTSGSLPGWIPVTGAQGTDTTPGFVALSYPDGPVIVDNTGKVVWYRLFPGGVLNSFHVHPNGRYTILGRDDTTSAFHVWDELGDEMGTIACLGFATRFHDVRVMSEGDYWILCDETRRMDLSGVGGVDTADVTATVLQHIGGDGNLLFQWNAFDHFEITDQPEQDRTSPGVNFTHGNAIDFDQDGNVLLSFRSLNEITKVDVATGAVMWRLGGLANQFTIEDDPNDSFVRQHGLRTSSPGTIQFLDNGNGAPSRLVRYTIDETTMTATLTLDFRDSPTTFTPVGGGTDYLPNGHALVSFGRAGRVVEADEAGGRAWELTGIDGVYVFRAQRITSLYPQER